MYLLIVKQKDSSQETVISLLGMLVSLLKSLLPIHLILMDCADRQCRRRIRFIFDGHLDMPCVAPFGSFGDKSCGGQICQYA